MIDQIKLYAVGAVLVALITALGLAKWELYSVTKEYSAYKENINDQLQAAINEKKRIEAEQNDKLSKAQRDYSATRRDLDSILARLRDGEIVPREESLLMAGSRPGSLPRETENPTGAIDPATITASIKSSPFFAAAMRDTLQCSRLIEFLGGNQGDSATKAP